MESAAWAMGGFLKFAPKIRTSLFWRLPIRRREVNVPKVRRGFGKLDGNLVLAGCFLADSHHPAMPLFPARHMLYGKQLIRLHLHNQKNERSVRVYHQRVTNFRHETVAVGLLPDLYPDAGYNALAAPGVEQGFRWCSARI